MDGVGFKFRQWKDTDHHKIQIFTKKERWKTALKRIIACILYLAS